MVRGSLTGTLVGLFILMAVVGPQQTEAYASDCGTHYETAVGLGSYQTNFHRGILVDPGNYIASPTPHCSRVASMYLYRSEFELVEYGWAKFGSGTYNQCNQSGSGTTWRLIDIFYLGRDHCVEGKPGKQIPSADIGSAVNFEIVNPDNNGIFDFYYGGTFLISNSNAAPFATGQNIIGTERYTTSDFAWGSFDGLQYENGSGFFPWTSIAQELPLLSNDPDYLPCVQGGSYDYWIIQKPPC